MTTGQYNLVGGWTQYDTSKLRYRLFPVEINGLDCENIVNYVERVTYFPNKIKWIYISTKIFVIFPVKTGKTYLKMKIFRTLNDCCEKLIVRFF